MTATNSEEPPLSKPTLSDRIVRWIRQELFAIVLVSILAVIGVVLIWNRITVTIPPGSVGVFYDRLFGGVRHQPVYREGLHFFFPWNKMYIYDCRIKQQTYTADILAFGGMAISIDVSVRWRVVPNMAPSLHVNLGPEYPDTLIRPVAFSAVRSVAGNQTPEGLYSVKPWEIHGLVLKSMRSALEFSLTQSNDVKGAGWKLAASLGKGATPPIIITDATILKVTLPDIINKSIDMKFAAAQRVVRERYKVLETVERYKAQYIDAAAIRRTQEIVNPGMTEDFLRFEGIRATLELGKSNNAKLVVMGGGKDGLPVILNPGAMDAPSPAVGGAAPVQMPRKAPAVPDLRQEFTWGGLREDLALMDKELRELASTDIANEVFNNPANTKSHTPMPNWGIESLGEPYVWPKPVKDKQTASPAPSLAAPEGVNANTPGVKGE